MERIEIIRFCYLHEAEHRGTCMGSKRRVVEKPVAPLYIEPGSPWENGYVESFNGKLRDEFLNREQMETLREARVLLEQWRHHYNTKRPHSSLGYRPPAPEVLAPALMPLA